MPAPPPPGIGFRKARKPRTEVLRPHALAGRRLGRRLLIERVEAGAPGEACTKLPDQGAEAVLGHVRGGIGIPHRRNDGQQRAPVVENRRAGQGVELRLAGRKPCLELLPAPGIEPRNGRLAAQLLQRPVSDFPIAAADFGHALRGERAAAGGEEGASGSVDAQRDPLPAGSKQDVAPLPRDEQFDQILRVGKRTRELRRMTDQPRGVDQRELVAHAGKEVDRAVVAPGLGGRFDLEPEAVAAA